MISTAQELILINCNFLMLLFFSQLNLTSQNFSLIFAAWELNLITIHFYWWLTFSWLPRAVYIQLLDFFQWSLRCMATQCQYNTFSLMHYSLFPRCWYSTTWGFSMISTAQELLLNTIQFFDAFIFLAVEFNVSEFFNDHRCGGTHSH